MLHCQVNGSHSRTHTHVQRTQQCKNDQRSKEEVREKRAKMRGGERREIEREALASRIAVVVNFPQPNLWDLFSLLFQ